jgi:hypothetical protein
MGKLGITDFVLYRKRYVLGFASIAILLVSILGAILFFSPNGISTDEMNSVVASTFTPPRALIGMSPESIVHLPYKLFQKLSLAALDVNLVSIKLPSMLMAIGSVFALYGLLRLWFRRNVAIISTIITVVTGQFLFHAQLGTPAIGYIFWNAAILYSVSMLARTEKYKPYWLLVATIFAALSLYSPLEVYVVIALLATCIIHPHARFIVLKTSNKLLIASGIIFTIIVTPLIIALITQPSLTWSLLGAPTSFDIFNLEIIKQQLLQYAGFSTPKNGTHVTPAYGLGIILMSLLGLYRLFTTKYTAKSYIITIWLCLLVPALLINPDAFNVTFIPVMILVAHGVDYLIRSWYRLFPNNPYARIFGLVPLSVLVIGLTYSGVERFVYSYHYDPEASSVFRQDLQLLDKAITKSAGKHITLVVPSDQQKFYTVYSDRKSISPRLEVTNTLPAKEVDIMIVERDAVKVQPKNPSEILVSAVSRDADRFYLYKKQSK